MSNDTQLTITGNLVDDPEPRYTPNGQPAVRFPDRLDAEVPRQGRGIGRLPGQGAQPVAASGGPRRPLYHASTSTQISYTLP